LAVPQDYLDKNIPVAYHQIVKGGYRLYWTINYMFGDSFVSDEAPPIQIKSMESPEERFLE